MQVPLECPQEIADLVEGCLSMEPHVRPSARDVFDVISKVKTAQDQLAAQDPWQVEEASTMQVELQQGQHQQDQPTVDLAGAAEHQTPVQQGNL